MKLIGAYPDSLQTQYLQELQTLLEQSISQGDYNGGQLYDSAAAAALTTQSEDFVSLSNTMAGDRSSADSFNQLVDLMTARYSAIQGEQTAFVAKLKQFLGVLESDGSLIHKLITRVELDNWVSSLPRVPESLQFSEAFEASHGAVSVDVSQVDPVSQAVPVDLQGVVKKVSDVSMFVDGEFWAGIGTPIKTSTSTAPIDLSWTVSGTGSAKSEELYGSDWAELNLLLDEPNLSFGVPEAKVILPKSMASSQVIRLKSDADFNPLPVYLRIRFLSRRTALQVPALPAGTSLTLSQYRISTDGMAVTDGSTAFEEAVDYDVNTDNGQNLFIVRTPLANRAVTVTFTEYFPAYQCSLNNLDWSPAVMLDPQQLFLDPQQSFLSIHSQDGWFPVMDEVGTPLGVWFQPIGLLKYEYLLQISTPPQSTYGVQAQLMVEFERPGYMNGIYVDPYGNFPLRLLSIQSDGLGAGVQVPLFQGDVRLDRPTTIRFDDAGGHPVYVKRLYLNVLQENYSFKSYEEQTNSSLRDEALLNLQAVLPYSTIRLQPTSTTISTGANYQFGIRSIAGTRDTSNGPGVFVSGPYTVTGQPNLIRLDTEAHGAVETYLLWKLIHVDGSTLEPTDGIAITPGKTLSFMDWTGITKEVLQTQFYVKWVLRADLDTVRRFNLQVKI